MITDLKQRQYRNLIWLYLICTVLPIVAQITKGYLLAACLAVSVTFLIVYFNRNTRIVPYLMPFAYLCVLEILFSLMADGFSFTILYSDIVGYLPALLGFLFFHIDGRQAKKTMSLLLLLYFITAVTSIWALQTDSTASRYLATGIKGVYADYLNLRNVGDYTTVYSMVLIYPMTVLLLKKRLIGFLPFAAISAIFIWFVLESQYVYAMLLMMINLLTILLPKHADVKKTVLYTILLVVVLLLFSQTVSQVLIYFSSAVGSLDVRSRLQSVVGLLQNNQIKGEDATGRMELYQLSFQSFLSSPVIGVWYKGASYIGGHSFILDMLAKFGMFGAAGILWMYTTIYKFVIKPYKERCGIGFFVVVFLLSILVALINTGNWVNVTVLYSVICAKVVFGSDDGNAVRVT